MAYTERVCKQNPQNLQHNANSNNSHLPSPNASNMRLSLPFNRRANYNRNIIHSKTQYEKSIRSAEASQLPSKTY